MRSFGKIVDLIIVILAVDLIPRLSSMLTNLLSPLILVLDADGIFAWVSIQHVIQLIITLLIMKFYFKSRLRDWGFNLENRKNAYKIIVSCTVIFIVIKAAHSLIIVASGGDAGNFTYMSSVKNAFGYYGFEAFLSGTCEEPLFRAFIILVVAQSWKGSFRIGKLDITSAGIISAVLFTIAHINYTIFPFRIISLNPLQLLTAFCLGFVYAVVFQKTKSLLLPIVLHNLSNVIVITVPYLIFNIF